MNKGLVNLNEYLDEINESDTHTNKPSKRDTSKAKVYTFYIKSEDIDMLEDLIDKEGGKVGEFIRKAIEKTHGVKFKSNYENKGRQRV